jgi:hypothetical protein
VKKQFMQSLNLEHLKLAKQIKMANVELLRSYPVLVLVTGDWAQNVSLDEYSRVKGDVHKIPTEPFDHFERLSCDAKPAESSEVSKAFRVLEYHCSVATYSAGEGHAWGLEGVSPMLSDMVILPRVLLENRMACVVHSFSHAVRKTLKDSLLLAGESRYKEDTWEVKAGRVDT